MRRPPSHALLLAALSAGLAAGGLGCGAETPPGFRIDVDLNGRKPEILRIAVTASPGGFAMVGGSGRSDVTVMTETDANGQPGVVLLFANPDEGFGPKFSFLLDTKNRDMLTMTASALGFNGNRLTTMAEPVPKTLTRGAQSHVQLVLTDTSGPIGPNTRTTDLGADPIDVTVKGGWPMARLSALASCNVDGQAGRDDVVIGAPTSPDSRALGAVGAVHVVLGGANIPREIDLETVGPSREFHFYGANPFDELGFSVACADVDGDGIGDIIAGAPGAANGRGRVYLVFGRPSIAATTINLATNMGQQIHVWDSTAANGRFGATVFALPAVSGGPPGMVLVSAPGAGTVHVLTPPSSKPAGIQAADIAATPHPTISGVAARALVAGRFTGFRDIAPLDVVVADSMLHPANDPTKQGVVYVFHAVDPALATAYAVGGAGALAPSRTMVGEDNSLYGTALAALDSGLGQDLLVGAPGELNGAGRVHMYKNDSMFFEFATLSTNNGALDGPLPNGRFGSSLAVAASGTGAGGAERLLVGAPDTARGDRTAAGAAYLYLPLSDRSLTLVDQLFGAAMDHRLGTAVAGGQIDIDNTVSDLIASAPGASGNGANSQAGIVYVLFNRGP